MAKAINHLSKISLILMLTLNLFGSLAGCGDSDELSDKDIEEIEEYLDESEDESSDEDEDWSDEL